MKNNGNRLGEILFSDRGTDVALMVLRIAAGFLLIRHGVQKIENFGELSHTFFDPIGLGGRLSLIMSICAEVGASVLIILGVLTRPAALILAFTMFVAAFLATGFTWDHSELPFTYMVIFIVLTISGGGRLSVDHMLWRMTLRQDPPRYEDRTMD